jgi:hypothetical protein
MAEPAVIERDIEATRVYHWRVHQFRSLEFTLWQSRRLAAEQASWHEAEALLAAAASKERVDDPPAEDRERSDPDERPELPTHVGMVPTATVQPAVLWANLTGVWMAGVPHAQL